MSKLRHYKQQTFVISQLGYPTYPDLIRSRIAIALAKCCDTFRIQPLWCTRKLSHALSQGSAGGDNELYRQRTFALMRLKDMEAQHYGRGL